MISLKTLEATMLRKDIPAFHIGDTVRVFIKIPEGQDKVRLHPFEGVVIAKKGSGLQSSFTVRKVSFGEGIERVFPINAPAIDRVEVVRSGKVKRAKLYYLRAKIGKRATKIAARVAKTPEAA